MNYWKKTQIMGRPSSGTPLSSISEYGEDTRWPAKQITTLIPQYQHQDLNAGQIRLILLEGGSHSSPLKCKIHHVSVDHAPIYDAISYQWGPEETPEYMKIDGQIFPIGNNLSDALRSVRRKDKGRFIWADYICINQKNLVEKTNQVRMMGTIYRNASTVCCWIGRGTKDSNAGMDYGNYMSEFFWRKWGAKVKLSRDQKEDYYERFQISNREEKDSLAFWRLFERDYWKCIWVRQEIIMANRCTIRCGNRILKFSRAMLVADAIQESINSATAFNYAYAGHMASYILGRARDKLGDPKNPSWLLIELIRNRSYQATRAEDRVFGLLEIFHYNGPPDKNLLQPNHNDSFKDTYLKIFQYCVFDAYGRPRNKGCLNILSASQPNRNSHPDIPSWLPDWSKNNSSLPMWNLKKEVSACNNKLPIVTLNGLGILNCRGFVLDTIKHVGNSLGEEVQNWDPDDRVLQRLYSWKLMVKRYSPRRGRHVDWKPFLRTITCGEIQNYDEFCDDWEKIDDYQLCYGLQPHYQTARFSKTISKSSRSRSRCFAISDEKRFLMVSRHCVPGDLVCIIFGCDVPVVLRRAPHSQMYTFVRDCYVDRYMTGRAMDRLNQGRHVEQDFGIM